MCSSLCVYTDACARVRRSGGGRRELRQSIIEHPREPHAPPRSTCSVDGFPLLRYTDSFLGVYRLFMESLCDIAVLPAAPYRTGHIQWCLQRFRRTFPARSFFDTTSCLAIHRTCNCLSHHTHPLDRSRKPNYSTTRRLSGFKREVLGRSRR